MWKAYVGYFFESLRTAENSPRNFLVLVLWNFSASEEYPVVPWSRARRLRIPAPPINSSLHLFPSDQYPRPVNKDIYIIFFTLCVAVKLAP